MTQLTIDSEQLDQLILQRLPTLVQQNRQIQELVLELARQKFADRKETESWFHQMLNELRQDREEQSRKWDEQNRKWEKYTAEQNLKWEEQNRKWDETQKEFQKVYEKIDALGQRLDRSIGGLGARWGLKSERSFRNALIGILEKSFAVKVLNVIDFDSEGTVFGRPEQIESDVIIKNGLLIVCEIKSSMSRSDMYTFERKVRFYEKRQNRQTNRMIVISPMVDARAKEIAQQLGIEIYSDAVDVVQ